MMGDAAVADGDNELAERCYAEAHRRHPHNPRAALNLGVTRLERREYAAALAALADLEELVGADRDGQWVELSLAGRYNAALAHWYRAYETTVEDTSDLREALIAGRRLALDVGHLLLDPSVSAERRKSLGTLQGGGLALVAAIIVDAVNARVDLGDAAGRVELELPKHAGRLRAKVGHDHGRPPAWLEALAADDWYRPTTVPVLEAAARRGHRHDGRTRYNLALLRARLLQKSIEALGIDKIRADAKRHGVDQAFEDLAFCLQADPAQVQWARDDRLIKPLADVAPERFAKLVPPAEEA